MREAFGASEPLYLPSTAWLANESKRPVYATRDWVVGAVSREKRTALICYSVEADWFCLDRTNGSVAWSRKGWGPNSIEGAVEPDLIVATLTTHHDMGHKRHGTIGISIAEGRPLWKYRGSPRWIKDSRIGCWNQRILDAVTGKVVGRWDLEDERLWCDTPEERLDHGGVELAEPAGARVKWDAWDTDWTHICRAANGEVLWTLDVARVCDMDSLRFVPPTFYGVVWCTDDGNRVTCAGHEAMRVHDELTGTPVTPIVIAIDARSGAVVSELPLPIRDEYISSNDAHETRPIIHADAFGLVVHVFDRIFAIRVVDV